MDKGLLLRNRAVSRIVVGIPQGHEHIRARIETGSGDVITLQEATIAALSRAYVGIKTHPHRQAVELRTTEIHNGKEGFATFQLLESDVAEGLLTEELAAPPGESTSPAPGEDAFDPAYDPTVPHRRADVPGLDGPATQPLPTLDVESGELDKIELDDDEPVFGDIPTVASKKQLPSKKSDPGTD